MPRHAGEYRCRSSNSGFTSNVEDGGVAGSVGARLGAGIDVSAVQIFKNNVEPVDMPESLECN